MRKPRLSHPTLLVPGFATGNAQFIPFRWWLRRHGVDAECWQEAPLLYTEAMHDHADALSDAIERSPHERITLVGWSYGGYLAPLAAARPGTRRRVARVIAFATPYDGTPVAKLGAVTDPFGLHVLEMAPGNPMLRRVATVVGVMRPGTFYALNGHLDVLARAPQEAVPVGCRIEGPWAHTSLLYDVGLFRVIHRLITRP